MMEPTEDLGKRNRCTEKQIFRHRRWSYLRVIVLVARTKGAIGYVYLFAIFPLLCSYTLTIQAVFLGDQYA